MNVIQKLKLYRVIAIFVLVATLASLVGIRPVFAAKAQPAGSATVNTAGSNSADKCTGVSPNEADCNTAIGSGDCTNLSKCDLMSQYINPLIKVLAALVGVVVVISVIIGGIQYSSSAGDPQAATAARKRITNAIIALVVFIFLYALLNFLIPGGLG